MTQTVRDLAPQILDKIKSAKNILLHCHPGPDQDSVGSVLAMKYALEGMGKKVVALRGDSEIPSAFAGMPGCDGFTQSNFVDFMKSGGPGQSVDLFIAMDSSSTDMISRAGEVVFPPSLAVVVIDHHVSNTRYGTINLVDSSYPATCQILADLFFSWGIDITREIATDLIMGIYSDTGGFKYQSVGPDTFGVMEKLVAIAPDYHKVIFGIENSGTAGELKFLGKALSSIETHCGGRLAIAAVPYDFVKKENLSASDMGSSDIANQLKSVVGWDIGVGMSEIEPGKIKVSFRTRDSERYDLSKIAGEVGGGGHRAAAGAFMTMPLDEAKAKIIDAVAKYIV